MFTEKIKLTPVIFGQLLFRHMLHLYVCIYIYINLYLYMALTYITYTLTYAPTFLNLLNTNLFSEKMEFVRPQYKI